MCRLAGVLIVFLQFLVSPLAFSASDELEHIKAMLNNIIPEEKPDAVIKAPVDGFYEVSYGSEIFYISRDGKFILQGDIVDVEKKYNLTEGRRSLARVKVIDAIDKDTMIIFSPKKIKHTITVFTDIDCGYCRKLHSEIDDYVNEGIEVRYLAYPRAGINSKSYDKAVSVWCAEDKQGAMTVAKLGGKLERNTCNDPVKHHMKAAALVGVTGTPSIVMENGNVLPGYYPAKNLGMLLDRNQEQ